MPKISICMAYHNRKRLLINTLVTLQYHNLGKSDFEVIIVDDGSSPDQRIADLPKMFPALNIFTLFLDPSKKNYINPCVPYNIAFSFASGDKILYQNTECMHVGDILSVVREKVKPNIHLSISTYSVSQSIQSRIERAEVLSSQNIKKIISPMVGFRHDWTDGDTCWYNHSIYRRALGSFCWAMTREDLESLNGFDERFAHGFAWDDAEMRVRIERKGMNVEYSNDPFVIHQWHVPSNYKKMKTEAEYNRYLYSTLTMKERGFKAPVNVFYNK